MVTGFVRMLHRAGKPEFYCIGWIDAPAIELLRRKPERFVERILSFDLECANWGAGPATSEIDRVCRSYLSGKLSHQGREIRMS
jgi:hypothetical protein